MCHGELDWEPNKNVNFVTGVNGSGKSSVLQGLVLGLLADSKHTKRYNKLQDFIQKGYNRATVQVTLKNEGEDAYKSEVYGSSITIQRTIKDNGQSTVLIKDHKQNVVKKVTKDAREEGKRILETFRINTDNPIAILQQEEAKELLKVESPENLYMFFQKATLLKQCVDQYSAAKTDLEKTRSTIETKRVQIRELGKLLKGKYEKLQELDKLKERDQEEKRLQKEFLWALVKENRAEQDKVKSKIAQKETALENPKEKLKSLHHVKTQLDNQMSKQIDKADQERGQYAKEERELTELKIETERLKEEEKSIKADIKGYVSMKKTLQSEISIRQEQLDQLNSGNNRDKAKQAQERQQKLNKLEERREEISEEIQRLGTERDKVETEQDVNKKDIEKSENERKGCLRKIEHLESELAKMVGMGDQKLAVFDRLAPRVADEIRNAAKNKMFNISPLGPLGSYIRLTEEAASDPNLGRLLETELGTNLVEAYLCNDDNDRRVLCDIFSKVYGQQEKPPIFTSKFLGSRHDVRRVQHYNTVMDYLEITGSQSESTIIFNHLVDQKSIESIVVCKSQDEAKEICSFHQNVPKNMNYAITYDFNRFFPPTNNTSYRSYYIDPKLSLMLGANMNSKVEEKKSDIQRTKESISDVNALSEKLLKIKASLKINSDKIKNGITDLRSELTKLSSGKSQLKAEEDSVDNIDAVAVAEKLEEKSNEFDHLCELQAAKLNDKDSVGKLIKEKGVEFSMKSKHVAKLREASNPIEREITKIEGQISSKKKEILNQEKVVKRYRNEVAQLKTELEEKEIEEKKFVSKAKQSAGPEIEPSGTVMQLNAKIKQIMDTKKKSNKVVADREALLEEYRELRDQYELLGSKISNIEEHVKVMEDMNMARYYNHLFIRKTISNMIRRRFAMLSESFSRQFDTQIFININHDKRELNFIFKNKDGDAINTEINSLSGGEKSYAQMCLIASLWENMNPPFRALDEWDVFLDALNRKNISSKLLEFGLTKLEYQFIFISPQGATDVNCDPSDQQRVSIMEVKKC